VFKKNAAFNNYLNLLKVNKPRFLFKNLNRNRFFLTEKHTTNDKIMFAFCCSFVIVVPRNFTENEIDLKINGL